MTTEEAGKILTILQAAFPHPPLTADRLRLYAAKLATLDFRNATKAIDRLTDDLDYFPTLAQLRKAVGEAGGLTLMLPSGESKPRQMMVYQVFDVEADDWLPIPEPVGLHSPEGQELIQQSRSALQEAGRRDKARTLAAVPMAEVAG